VCCPGHFRSESGQAASFGVRVDYQDCQNGLVEDHSGGYRIEALRPDGCLIGLRHGEVRPVLIQSPLGSGHDHLWQIRTP
jgi:hypothetical protein